MSEASFKIEPDPQEAANGKSCGDCPLKQIPLPIWQKLITPTFRSRHPIIFALFILFILVGGVAFGWVFLDRDSISEESLALVNIQGPIISSEPTLTWLNKIENNPLIKGVLVRVDSPGGGAAASQEIYAGLERIASKMPVAISMGATAASGGLMVSMAGQRIFASPSTVTGSIGVRMDIPQLQGLMHKIGIGQETLVSGPFKDAVSYTRPLTPEDRAYLQNIIANMHQQFVEIVAKGRHFSKEKAESLANGKIFTGQEALGLGLIDVLGGQYEAHRWLAEKTGVPFEQGLFTKSQKTSSWVKELIREITGLDFTEFEKLAPNSNRPVFLYQWP